MGRLLHPAAVLVVGVLVAVLAAAGIDGIVDNQVERRLGDTADRAAAVVELQLRRYASTTRAAAAVRPDAASLDDWLQDIERLGLGVDLPSHLGINATTAVRPADVAAFERSVAATGLPGFAVRPPLDGAGKGRELLLVVDRVSPLAGNEPALGFDVLANPDAAGAALRAYELGVPALSEALTLVQETEDQTGLVIYFPWSDGEGTGGVISLVLRGQDFLDALAPQLGDVRLTITDETPSSGERTIGALEPLAPPVPGLHATREVQLFGQRWTLTMTGTTAMISFAERMAGFLTAAAILLVTLLSTALAAVLRRGADVALALVGERTAELVAANRELGEAVAAKDEFLSVIGHEFRTPLTVIRGFASTLVDGRAGEVSPEMALMLERIDVQSGRINGLLDDLLIAASLHNGEVSVNPEPLGLRDLVAHVLRANRGRVPDATTDIPADLRVMADPTHATRILWALLGNAAKYGRPPVVVTARRRGDVVVIRVRDHGPGVPVGMRERVFERFAQADAGSTRESSGVGLGLAIVRDLCERNHGTVALVDTDGTGACFEVRLPAADDRATSDDGVTTGTHDGPR